MQKVNLLTYADKNYAELQKQLCATAEASKVFDKGFAITRDDLEKTSFYTQNKHILDQPRGAGYWLWKPYLIYEMLQDMEPNDILMHMDCGDSLEETETLREFLQTNDIEVK